VDVNSPGMEQQETMAFAPGEAEPPGASAGASGQVLFDDGTLRIARNGSRRWLTMAGEIDEFTYDGLVTALIDVTDAPGEIHIDLAGVQYCDVAGLRALVLLATGQCRDHSGRRVVLHELAADLKTVLQILGWDSTPGLVIEDRQHCQNR